MIGFKRHVEKEGREHQDGGDYGQQQALVFHPDDPLFARFRTRLETEQGTLAKKTKPKRQQTLPLWLQEQLAEEEKESGITPLESNALALRFALLKPGPDLAMRRPEEVSRLERWQAPALPPLAP